MRKIRPHSPCLGLNRRRYSSSSDLVHIRSGTFYREHPSSVPSSSANPPLFPNLTFALTATAQTDVGEPVRKTGHWAVIGASDTTTFLNILRGGFLCIPPNARTYPYLASNEVASKDQRLRIPSHAIQYVGFNTGNKTGLGGVGGTQGAYLSARYESRREETDWSVLQYLKGETELNPSEELSHTVKDEDLLNRVIRDLRLGRLLDMPVSNLSNGQTRRCRIAKALLSEPKCLLLDEPFMGLDPPTLVTLSPILRELAWRSDPLLVLGLRPQDPVPDWITDVVVLGKNHGVGLIGSRDEVLDILSKWGKTWQGQGFQDKNPSSMSNEHIGLAEKFGAPFEGFGDVLTKRGIVPFIPQVSRPDRDTNSFDHASDTLSTRSSEVAAKSKGNPLIELESITLSYGPKVVLGHKTQSNPNGGLNLSINEGTRLALLGPNGSGKTTLLSLLTSDHPQSYSLPIKFFGRTRLPSKGKPGLSLWEIQSRIGHSAPEVHAFYPKGHTIRRVLESAWAETYAAKPVLDADASALIDRVLAYWTPELKQNGEDGASATASADVTWANDKEMHYFRVLPFATQRLLLLLRAIIKSPDIVILDEAFSGLDAATREKAMSFLEHGESAMSSSDPIRAVLADMPGRPFQGLTDQQALVVVSHVRKEVPRCVDQWVRLPSEEEATETGKDVLMGSAHELGGGRGLRSKEGWGEVWGM